MIVRQQLAVRKTRNSKSKERRVEERGRHLKTGGYTATPHYLVLLFRFGAPSSPSWTSIHLRTMRMMKRQQMLTGKDEGESYKAGKIFQR